VVIAIDGEFDVLGAAECVLDADTDVGKLADQAV
jgi:hypothetical protein